MRTLPRRSGARTFPHQANLLRKRAYTLRRRPSPGLVWNRLRNLRKVESAARRLEAALLSVDGFGDFASASWGFGSGAEVTLDGKVHFPHSLTGVPMVLNTSFNENEPIVHRPEEALDGFLRTDMDVLALGPWVVRKAPVSALA